MATKAELKQLVIDKISIAGTRDTTGMKVRQLMDPIIDALFDQFPQWFKQSAVNLAAGVDFEFQIPGSAGKSIANVDIFDAFGYKLDSTVLVKKGVHSGTGNLLIILNAAKVQNNLEVNTLVT
tara:strand:+ start:838 stop:1206 length:369 start_codon:yes stop_codon:yes gene_type:complete